MRRALFILGGVLLGAAIHIAVVLLVPVFAVNDAWANVAALGADSEFHILPPSLANTEFRDRDPLLVEAACRFSIADVPTRITATLPDGFWSMALFDRAGRNVYSINDRAGDASRLDVLVMTPEAQTTFSESRLAALPNTIVATPAFDAGIAVVRVFVPDEAAIATATAALTMASCDAPF